MRPDNPATGHRPDAARGGQVILFVLAAVLALLAAILWLADLHTAVLGKDKTQNAGDAAALEAARWQGASLNVVGELNLLHVLALAAGDEDAAETISEAAVRASFAGPVAGAAAAQQAAKLNGAPSNDGFTQFVRERALVVRRGYGRQLAGEDAMPEPWPGAWGEYSSMLDALADEGVAAGPDNAAFFDDPSGSHILLNQGFYAAVLGRSWCWFHWAAPTLLDDYAGWSWWPPLPPEDDEPPASSEILSLHLRTAELSGGDLAAMPGLPEAFGAEGLPNPFAEGFPDEIAATNPAPGFLLYRPSRWGAWETMRDPSFTIEGKLKPEYDYAGADAAMRVENPVRRLTAPEADAGTLVWTGAAKPFGKLEDEGGGAEPPTAVPLVLPVFEQVRLVPLDAVEMQSGGAFDLAWRRHCREHLPPYLERGTSALVAGCRYCRALDRWEVPSFRLSGSRWLATNSWKCTVSPPGGGPGGGSRHAH